jgi:anti-sigma regulatory factor (Ser/Thr protein kinase)
VHEEVRASSSVLLPCAPASVAVARRVISDELKAEGIFDSAICDVVLVVSELLSNAIRHAYPLPGDRLRLAWDVDGSWVEIAVSDGGGATLPHAGRAPVSALGGRGLSIVAHLSDAWGVRSEELGLTVWAVLKAPRGGMADGHRRAAAASGNGAASRAAADGGLRPYACEA